MTTSTSASGRKILDAGIGIVYFSLDSLTDEGLRKMQWIRESFKKCWTKVEDFIELSRKAEMPILKVIQMVRLEVNQDREHKRKLPI